jgi:hypothetical protein
MIVISMLKAYRDLGIVMKKNLGVWSFGRINALSPGEERDSSLAGCPGLFLA